MKTTAEEQNKKIEYTVLCLPFTAGSFVMKGNISFHGPGWEHAVDCFTEVRAILE